MKQDKADVDYTPKAAQHNERCELCRHFLPLHNRCKKVAGEIAPAGWCDLFARKT